VNPGHLLPVFFEGAPGRKLSGLSHRYGSDFL